MHVNLTIHRLLLIGFLLISELLWCQLNDFNLSVSTTDETCAGNGSISMTVSGTTAGATMTYRLYLYPDTTTPIFQTSANSFNNLSSGNYLVVATQTLGTDQNTQSADATINNETSALNFEVGQAYNGNCNAANLVVNVTSGNPVSYEIISGPVTVPSQTSNIFEDMPEGTYVVRVYDSCNNALTKTYTLVFDTSQYVLGPLSMPSLYENCDEATITNNISALNEGLLSYPISVSYTITPPDGSPVISFTHNYSTGPESQLAAVETIDLYGNDIFSIEIVTQDGCGHTITRTYQVDPNPSVSIVTSAGYCGKNMSVQVRRVLPPYTLEFTDAPDGFDPTAFNGDFPGPFSLTSVVFGQEEAGVPYGSYTVNLVDACGRTGTDTFVVEEELIEPEVSTSNSGCNPEFGLLLVNIPDREVATAIFTQVPDDYGEPAPVDVSSYITSTGNLLIETLPQGDYILELTDHCGSSYIEEVTIPGFSPLPLSVLTTPNCATPTGTLRIASPYGDIESIFITAAPASFAQTLPYDYSSQILSIGIFYVGNLPEGTYTIEFSDSCGNDFEISPNVEAYESDDSIYILQRNCGSFDLGILDTNESVWDQSYWFQRYDPDTDTWGHPYTGVPYTDGDMPDTTNSVEIENEETIYNIFLTGTFRLIKAFQPFNNPNTGQRCYDVFAEFEVSSDLIIRGVYNLNCEGGTGPSDIFVDVLGVEPYNFSIVSPITVDNGNNNIFTDLEPGSYEIMVEDVCGSIENIFINLEDLLPVVNILTPPDLVVCGDLGTTQSVFDLSQQDTLILGGQNPQNFTLTYHTSLANADAGINPLPDSYQNISSPQTIYVRVIHNTLDICYETTSFQLIVGSYPQLSPDQVISVCDGGATSISADAGFDTYLWSTGATTRTIAVTESGTYTVTVSEAYSDFFCDATQSFTVYLSGSPTIEDISLVDFSPYNNSISVTASGLGDYEYSLDGIVYQPDPTFNNLQSGEYTVYVRDRNGCGVVTKDVYLLNYKKFFTPNGDGRNEYWQIAGSQFEPDLEITVYDRYGKLLTSFKGDDSGWDGTYNGYNMPTSDYWFVVNRRNGRIYKGHFTLKR